MPFWCTDASAWLRQAELDEELAEAEECRRQKPRIMPAVRLEQQPGLGASGQGDLNEVTSSPPVEPPEDETSDLDEDEAAGDEATSDEAESTADADGQTADADEEAARLEQEQALRVLASLLPHEPPKQAPSLEPAAAKQETISRGRAAEPQVAREVPDSSNTTDSEVSMERCHFDISLRRLSDCTLLAGGRAGS